MPRLLVLAISAVVKQPISVSWRVVLSQTQICSVREYFMLRGHGIQPVPLLSISWFVHIGVSFIIAGLTCIGRSTSIHSIIAYSCEVLVGTTDSSSSTQVGTAGRRSRIIPFIADTRSRYRLVGVGSHIGGTAHTGQVGSIEYLGTCAWLSCVILGPSQHQQPQQDEHMFVYVHCYLNLNIILYHPIIIHPLYLIHTYTYTIQHVRIHPSKTPTPEQIQQTTKNIQTIRSTQPHRHPIHNQIHLPTRYRGSSTKYQAASHQLAHLMHTDHPSPI